MCHWSLVWPYLIFFCNWLMFQPNMPLAQSPKTDLLVQEPQEPIVTCLLCDEHLTGSSVAVTTECGHVFHRYCLHNYLRDTPKCPICESSGGIQLILDGMPGPSATVVAEETRVHDTRYRGQRRPVSHSRSTQLNKSNAPSEDNLSNPDTQPTRRPTRGRRGMYNTTSK